MIKEILYYALICLPAIVIWGMIYYYKDPYRLRKRELLGTFVLGILALLPLIVYVQIAQNLFAKLHTNSMISDLVQNPYFLGLMEFALTMLFMSVTIFLMISIITVFLTRLRKDNFKNIYRSTIEETANFELAAFVIGIVVLIETSIKATMGYAVIGSVVGVIMIMAVMEEYIKHLLVRMFNDNKLQSVDHAIAFSIFVGLGFAFAENIYYMTTMPLFNVWMFAGRSLFSTFGHVLFSAIFGYYYGVAHFSRPIAVNFEVEHHKLFSLPGWLFKIIPVKRKELFHAKKIAEGLLIAMILHAGFNLIMVFNLAMLAPVLFVGGYWILNKILKDKENKKVFGLIGTDIMPPGDYEKLVTQINAIKWSQQIARERAEREKKIAELKKEQQIHRRLGRFSIRLLDYIADELAKTRKDEAPKHKRKEKVGSHSHSLFGKKSREGR